MLVTLIGQNNIRKLVLPSTPEGSYWIKDKSEKGDKKLLNIEGKDGNWQIISNNNAKIVNAQYVSFKDGEISVVPDEYAIIKKVVLKNGGMYFVSIESLEEVFVLFCSDVYDSSFVKLDILDKKDIEIGKTADNDIIYSQSLVAGKHAKIFYNNNSWYVENYDEKYGTFVNNIQIAKNAKRISNGDVVFIMGLKIVIIGDSLFVNNPAEKMKYLLRSLMLNKQQINPEKINKVDDNDDVVLYKEEDYFSRAPRIVNKIEREKIDIDQPPAQRDEQEMPMLLTMGSSLSMAVMTIITMYTTIDGLQNKTMSVKESIPKFIMTFSMLIAMLLMPVITRKWQNGQKKKYEKKRQQRYRKYINSKITTVNEIMDKQRNILNQSYVSAKDSEQIVLNKDARIWERKMEDYEFLSVRLGEGDVPLDIDISYPKESFTMEDDELVSILSEIGEKSKILEDAPIAVSLVEKNVSSVIIKNDEDKIEYTKNLIMQLVALHSYIDLKLVFLVDEDSQGQWDFVKMLPHVWNSTNQVRFFADNYNDMKQLSKYLEEVLESRNEYTGNDVDYKQFAPYYLIITDNYKKIENLKIISDMLDLKRNLGFSLLCLTEDLTQLPNECKTFITIENGNGKIFESENSSTTQIEFTYNNEPIDFSGVSRVLGNIPIKYSTSGSMMLPSSYTFLEMYDVGKIDQLNISERWRTNDTTLSLQAPIGIDATGLPIALDIHEKFHGPHGLIAGSTGSGKSEFIITYILSLAVNYHPDDVNFVLIDYKGGGLAGAFKKRDVKLPHLVGTITNIDKVGLQRSLDSIQSELRKRQIMFNQARDMTEESTIDIYKYQKLYHDGVVEKPIPHLFIICDEFAELKQQQPDFMDELISVARIGRSLGVHLILATQKPAGIVNDQIRSNSKFGVCLKVQDKSDSMDVIKKPDAAKLKKAGQFYINVGNDEYFALGQSAWAGAQYFPSDVVKKEIDTSVEFVSNLGSTIKSVNNVVKQKNVKSQGDQLTNIVDYICELAKSKNIDEGQLWLDAIPENIYIRGLKAKYDVKTEKNYLNPIIGEYDDPSNQKQGLLTLNLTDGGNTLIFGSADSGKETLISTVIYDTVTNHSVKEVAFYLLDFGSETLKTFSNTPQVGDVVLANDTEKVQRLIEMLKKEINKRKKILSEYNGDYNLYCKSGEKSMPAMVVILNNYAAFSENYQDLEEDLQAITRDCTKCGIIFIITASSYRDLRYRLIQNFKQKISLQLNSEDDYMYIFDKIGKKRPSKLHGRGLVAMESGQIFEFQTAQICRPEQLNSHINTINKKLLEINKSTAKRIPVMPEIVKIENVKKSLKGINAVPIGMSLKTLGVCTFDFIKNLASVITAKDIDDACAFSHHLAEEVKLLDNVEVIRFEKDMEIMEVQELYNKYIDANTESKNPKYMFIIIEDIEKFISFMPNGATAIEQMIDDAKENKNASVVVVDNATKVKNHQFDAWYKNNITNDTGIWVGNGVDNQYVITGDVNRREVINKNCIGYIIKQGMVTQVKLLGIKQRGEENE